MNAPYLPPVARPPHDPRTLTLDPRHGWHAAANPLLGQGTIIDPDTDGIALAPLAGTGRLLAEPSGSFGGLDLAEPCGLAPRRHDRSARPRCAPAARARPLRLRVRRVALHERQRPAPAGRGAGDRPRLRPVAAAARRPCTASSCSTPAAARCAACGPAEPSPTASPGRRAAAAVTCDRRVLVADAANGAIHVLSPRGVPLDLISGLGAVRALAVDSCDRVYVRTDDTGRGPDRRCRPEADRRHGGRARRDRRMLPAPCRSISTAMARSTSPASACRRRPPPCRSTCTAGRCRASYADNQPHYPADGAWMSAPLDSEIAACVWDRIALRGQHAGQGRVTVETLTADTVLLDDELADPQALWRAAGLWRGDESALPAPAPISCCSRRPGRYLWLRLRLAGTSTTTPRIDCARARVPAHQPAPLPAGGVRRRAGRRRIHRPLARDLRPHVCASIEAEIDEQARAVRSAERAGRIPRWRAAATSWPSSPRWVGRHAVHRLAARAASPRPQARPGASSPGAAREAGLRSMLYLFLGLDRCDRLRAGRRCCVPCVTASEAALAHGGRRDSCSSTSSLRRWMALDHARLSDAAKLWGGRIVNRSRLEARPACRRAAPATARRSASRS